jgi:hypothetical protein
MLENEFGSLGVLAASKVGREKAFILTLSNTSR